MFGSAGLRRTLTQSAPFNRRRVPNPSRCPGNYSRCLEPIHPRSSVIQGEAMHCKTLFFSCPTSVFSFHQSGSDFLVFSLPFLFRIEGTLLQSQSGLSAPYHRSSPDPVIARPFAFSPSTGWRSFCFLMCLVSSHSSSGQRPPYEFASALGPLTCKKDDRSLLLWPLTCFLSSSSLFVFIGDKLDKIKINDNTVVRQPDLRRGFAAEERRWRRWLPGARSSPRPRQLQFGLPTS